MSDEFETVPLFMLSGNLDALMKAHDEDISIPVNGISLRRESRGVRLIVQMSEEQKAEAEKLGFQTRRS